MNCQGRAHIFGGECLRTGTVERNGKHYCWQHDPDRLVKEREARCQKTKAENAVRDRRLDRQDVLSEIIRKVASHPDFAGEWERFVALGGSVDWLRNV
jgi:hypothetical protein